MPGRDDDNGLAAPDGYGEGSDGGVGNDAATRSIVDDIDALIEDARTYVDAELSYQKSRAGFVATCLKHTVAFGIVAVYFAVLATIGLTVGLIIALTPYLTAWGATAVVVLALLLVTIVFALKSRNAVRRMMAAMKSDEELPDHD